MRVNYRQWEIIVSFRVPLNKSYPPLYKSSAEDIMYTWVSVCGPMCTNVLLHTCIALFVIVYMTNSNYELKLPAHLAKAKVRLITFVTAVVDLGFENYMSFSKGHDGICQVIEYLNILFHALWTNCPFSNRAHNLSTLVM